MSLRLDSKWVWDSWYADDGHTFHAFYLQAPRSLGEQHRRHRHATVGHAVSTDLRDWRVLSDVLLPGARGAWDDIATWTGSVLPHEGTWYMYYTGTSSREDGLVQRLGLATSTDLETWAKHPGNPIMSVDPRWYEELDLEAWHDQAWRDPWVFPDPEGDGFHALITARTSAGAPDGRGVIAHARSPNLVDWDVQPPLSQPGEFGQLEVPQVELVDDTPVLLFSSNERDRSALRRSRRPGEDAGTYLAVGESLLGPWNIADARALPVRDLYSARLIRDRAGDWQVIGFIDGSQRDEFVGELTDPIALKELGLP